jgi:predicted GNAT family acetyltransferase
MHYDSGEAHRHLRCATIQRTCAMSVHSTEIIVRHNAPEHRFEAEVDRRLSVADYTLRGTGMILSHTCVPPELRGKGIAEKIVRVALEHARSERLRVVPACSYVNAFIKRHAEYQPLLK